MILQRGPVFLRLKDQRETTKKRELETVATIPPSLAAPDPQGKDGRLGDNSRTSFALRRRRMFLQSAE